MKDLLNKKLKGVAKLSQLYDLRKLVEDGDFHEAINKEIEERLKSKDLTGIQEGSWYLEKWENGIRLYRVDHIFEEEEWAKFADCTSIYIYTDKPMSDIDMWSRDTVTIVDLKKMKSVPKDVGDAVVRLYKDAHEGVKKTWHDTATNALDLINRPYW